MARTSKRKLPVTYNQTHSKSNIKSTQQRISRYHVINKRLAQLASQSHLTQDQVQEQEMLEKELTELGGLDAYQKASLKGGNERVGKGYAGKWVAPLLQSQWKVRENKDSKFKLLDVGALNGDTYSKYTSWMQVESIDLNPQHPLVKKQDFFERPLPVTEQDVFDCVALSLVVNFVPCPHQRGMMLKRACQFLPLQSMGHIYIVLPLPCIKHSRYLNHTLFLHIMTLLGCHLEQHHFSRKLAFYLFKHLPGTRVDSPHVPKTLVESGPGRNNFSIILDEK